MQIGKTFKDAFEIFAAARDCAAAVNANRTPPARALKRLGIDASGFNDLGLR